MTIRCDDRGFGAGNETLRWDELEAVGIRTSADGPVAEDCFWQFLLRDGRCVELPVSLLQGDALELVLARLPGVDAREIVTAMGSVEPRVFRVWHAEESSWQWDARALAARFAALVERLGGDPARAGEAFLGLDAAWRAPGRRYHDREHLLDCLRELDGAGVERARADVAELALWYHDAIYEPGRRDSEERSARLLLETAEALHIPGQRALASAACVRATAHARGAAPSEPSVDLVLDVDLSILGRDDLRFFEYEYAIAEEYSGVWSLSYFIARGRFLAALLAAPFIYRTPHFRERYEARARVHLTELLASPRYRLHRWASGLRSCFGQG